MKSSKRTGQKLLPYGYSLKEERLKFTFLTGLASFWYVRVYRQRRLKSPKTGVSTEFKALTRPETENWVYFLYKNFYIRRLCSVKANGLWLKNQYFSSSACLLHPCQRSCRIYWDLMACMRHLKGTSVSLASLNSKCCHTFSC